jgi:hypothetical protein
MTKSNTITVATRTADGDSATKRFGPAKFSFSVKPLRILVLGTVSVFAAVSAIGGGLAYAGTDTAKGGATANTSIDSALVSQNHRLPQYPNWDGHRWHPRPTVTPTVKPTVTPTVKPTVTPTVKPTVTPTVKPTVTPTVKPTVTPTVKPTVTPTVKPTVVPTVAPTGVYPAPVNIPKVGVPAGTVLKPMAGLNITQAGTVIDSADISGGVDISAANVVIRRSRISGQGDQGINVRSGSLTVEDTTVTGFDNSIVGGNYTATRVEVTQANDDGFKIGDNVTIQGSYCHDMVVEAGAHADCGQVQSGVENVLIRGNWFDVGSTGGNAALFMAPDLGPSSAGPLVVENNVLGGGNFVLQCVDGNNGQYFIASITIRNNQFLRNSNYGPMRVNVPITSGGNIYKDNGQSAE